MNALSRSRWFSISDLFLGVLFAVLLLLLYLAHQGFPETSLRALERRLQTRGMAIGVDSARLSIFEGLIIKGVRCYQRGSIESPLLDIESLILKWRPGHFIAAGRGGVEAVVRNGVFRLPVGGAGERQDAVLRGATSAIRLDNINAVLELDRLEGSIRVADLSAWSRNMRMSGRGVVILPGEKKIAVLGRDMPDRVGAASDILSRESAAEVVGHVERVLSKNAAIVEADFKVELADLRNLHAVLEFESRETRAAPGCSRAGTASGYVRFNGGMGEGVVNARSRFLHGVWVEEAVGRFELDANGMALRRLDAMVGGETGQGPLSISAAYLWNTREYVGRIETGFDPHALLPPLEARGSHAVNIIDDFRFDAAPPSCSATFAGKLGAGWNFSARGAVVARRCSYRGVSNKSFNIGFAADLSETVRKMRLAPVDVEFEDGRADAELTFDFLSKIVEFQGFSRTDPRNIAQMIGPLTGRLVGNFRFDGLAEVVASGIACINGGEKNDFDVVLNGRGFGWDRFICEEGSLHVRGLGRKVDVAGIRGAAYGGTFEGHVSFRPIPDSTNMHYEVEARVDDLDFGATMRELTDRMQIAQRGRCSATASIQGRTGPDQLDSLAGQGKLRIADGRIFQVPLFGQLSDMMTKLVPGLGLVLKQTDVKAPFDIGSGKISSDRILVEGDVFSMRGSGSYALDGTLDFDAQFVLFRQHTLAGEMMRIITLPLSKIFEFRLSGTAAEPRWRPTYLPRELFFLFHSGG